jgi:hypothetical protein
LESQGFEFGTSSLGHDFDVANQIKVNGWIKGPQEKEIENKHP